MIPVGRITVICEEEPRRSRDGAAWPSVGLGGVPGLPNVPICYMRRKIETEMTAPDAVMQKVSA